ncbi:MAG: hypothetical protein KUG72_09870 [Pseudomonadales bacterium]|nr:hypothetical protein [Pseudomonadales bacterium]
MPSLKLLSSSESKSFLTAVKSIVYADQKITFFEFVMLTILEQHLQDKPGRADKIKYRSFKAVIDDIYLILSVLVHQSKQSRERKESSFNRCIASFTQSPLTILSMNEVSFRKISQSLGRLNLLSFLLKKCVLEAFADSVLDDGIIMPGEAELLRAISESMGCPMPPLLPDSFKSP